MICYQCSATLLWKFLTSTCICHVASLCNPVHAFAHTVPFNFLIFFLSCISTLVCRNSKTWKERDGRNVLELLAQKKAEADREIPVLAGAELKKGVLTILHSTWRLTCNWLLRAHQYFVLLVPSLARYYKHHVRSCSSCQCANFKKSCQPAKFTRNRTYLLLLTSSNWSYLLPFTRSSSLTWRRCSIIKV